MLVVGFTNYFHFPLYFPIFSEFCVIKVFTLVSAYKSTFKQFLKIMFKTLMTRKLQL